MSLNIKNGEVEQLARDVASITGETKTEAIRKSLRERRERLTVREASGDRARRVQRLMEDEIWPLVPKAAIGKRLSRKQQDKILGYGPEGV